MVNMKKNIKIVTFNLRVSVDDGINSWGNRKRLVFNKINEELPDIIGFQEITEESLMDLREEFKNYVFVGCGRDKDLSGEYVIFAYNKDNIDLLNLEVFWLSNFPHIAGTTYENGSSCPRTCSVGVFRTILDKKTIRVYNLHMDHIGSEARLNSATQILNDFRQREEWLSMPTVILGDFNATPDAEEIERFNEYNNGIIRDITDKIQYSFHDYGRLKEKIDYVFLSGGVSCMEVKPWTDCEAGIYLSDHYPIAASICFDK